MLTKKKRISMSLSIRCQVRQQSPTFLAPGTGFMEDSFSTARVWGGGGMVQAVMRAMGSDTWSFTRLPLTSSCVAQFLTGCRPVISPQPGGWGPLMYIIFSKWQNYRDGKHVSGCQGYGMVGGWAKGAAIRDKHKGDLRDDGPVPYHEGSGCYMSLHMW